MPRKISKKKSRSPTHSKTKNLNWHEQGEVLLQKYLNKFKNPKSCLAVLSSFGDPLLKSGKGEHLDWTSLGSIFSAVQSAGEGLNKLLSKGTSVVQFGDPKGGFWVEWVPGSQLLVGIGVPYKPSDLKIIQKHLKSSARQESGIHAREALDGMSAATVDAALRKEIR